MLWALTTKFSLVLVVCMQCAYPLTVRIARRVKKSRPLLYNMHYGKRFVSTLADHLVATTKDRWGINAASAPRILGYSSTVFITARGWSRLSLEIHHHMLRFVSDPAFFTYSIDGLPTLLILPEPLANIMSMVENWSMFVTGSHCMAEHQIYVGI